MMYRPTPTPRINSPAPTVPATARPLMPVTGRLVTADELADGAFELADADGWTGGLQVKSYGLPWNVTLLTTVATVPGGLFVYPTPKVTTLVVASKAPHLVTFPSRRATGSAPEKVPGVTAGFVASAPMVICHISALWFQRSVPYAPVLARTSTDQNDG